MMTLILFGFFFVLVILNVPIGVSLGLAASIGLIYADFPLSVIPGIMYSGTGKFALLAVPFFIMAGVVVLTILFGYCTLSKKKHEVNTLAYEN